MKSVSETDVLSLKTLTIKNNCKVRICFLHVTLVRFCTSYNLQSCTTTNNKNINVAMKTIVVIIKNSDFNLYFLTLKESNGKLLMLQDSLLSKTLHKWYLFIQILLHSVRIFVPIFYTSVFSLLSFHLLISCLVSFFSAQVFHQKKFVNISSQLEFSLNSKWTNLRRHSLDVFQLADEGSKTVCEYSLIYLACVILISLFFT